ncbi:phosphatidylglycerophosphate synthase [Theileria orientalis]|uniref:CDP-diacylglycerol--glycerol-3-phosphate 3-phosphatidyltransferase n=1 Tax=Theileria orientalis TaxID=68886 RepID=A0A976QUE2_THEOR|nr:phosphatidylglycerophosphate synthase [Theileria orientalis]
MESDFVLEYFTESTNIKFLYDPKSYYNQLCSMIKNAKEKVVISCLYIGTLPLEQDFVNHIVYAKKNNPDLIVELLLDKNRSLRRENTGNCILDLIKPLLLLKNVKVGLYHSPLCDAVLNRVLRPPLSEVFGTLHMKIYVADSVTVISGANCSTPYFTTRMDRYMVVDDLLFSNVMHTVVSTLSTMAFRATPSMGFEWVSDLANPLDDYLLFKKQIYRRILTMIKMCNEALEPILMEKLEHNMELESKRSRAFRFLNKLTRRKSNSSKSTSTYGLNFSRQNSVRNPESARSVSSTSPERLRSIFSSVKKEESPNEIGILSINEDEPDTTRSVNTSSSIVSRNIGGTNASLSKQNSIERTVTMDTTKDQEGSEALVRHTLSGDYLLTPHMYSERYNSMKGSYTSRLGATKYSILNSSRNTLSSEYCEACENYNQTTPNRVYSLKVGSDVGNENVGEGESEMVCEELGCPLYKLNRKYPPMDGFTRFMILFQLGFSEPPFRQDEVLCKDLMIKYRKSGHSIVLATSYLNFTDDYSDLCSYLLNCNIREKGSFYVVTSSPSSNDFNNCTDWKRLIPRLYCIYQSLMMNHVMEKLGEMNEKSRDWEDILENKFYHEYQNPGYTFHHKGIWMFHGDIPENTKELTFGDFKKRINGPCTMLIGSSNISRRSQNKDLEMTVMVETSSVNVLDQIKLEVYDLFKNSTCVPKSTVTQRSRLLHRIMAFVLRQYF